jgi:hypothetical protein
MHGLAFPWFASPSSPDSEHVRAEHTQDTRRYGENLFREALLMRIDIRFGAVAACTPLGNLSMVAASGESHTGDALEPQTAVLVHVTCSGAYRVSRYMVHGQDAFRHVL